MSKKKPATLNDLIEWTVVSSMQLAVNMKLEI